MTAANVTLEWAVGEDYTCQIVWTDDQGQPMNITAPMRLDIKSATQTVLSLTTPDVAPTDGTIPEISYSSEIGIMQIHIPKEQTATLPPGLYQYDMFVTVNDGDAYAGNQVVRLMAGQCIVNSRITVM